PTTSSVAAAAIRADPAAAPSTCSMSVSPAIHRPIPGAGRDDPVMRPLLIAFGAVQVVLGLLLWLTPGFFCDEIGRFGPRNDHYMGDVATWYLALGAAALIAVQRTSWRVPVLALALIQYALHSFNHLIDIGESDP